MQPTDQDPDDIDASLRAASQRLLREMSDLIERGRRLVGQGPAWSVSPGTLGAVLYSRPSPVVPERDWVSLVRAVAERDEPSLHELCERTHGLVLSLISCITGDRRLAEALAIEVLVGVWREAGSYDPSDGTVLAWIMNRARAKALEPPSGMREVAEDAAVSPQARLARRIQVYDNQSIADIARDIASQHGLTPVVTALAANHLLLIMAVFSIGLSAKLVVRFGLRLPIFGGMLLTAAGLALFALSPANGSFALHVLPGESVLELGAGKSPPEGPVGQCIGGRGGLEADQAQNQLVREKIELVRRKLEQRKAGWARP